MQKIIFRADASVEIGYGHFVRTLALADMLKDDFDCYFATIHPTEYQLNEIGKVCQYLPIPADNSHFDYFLSLLQGDEIVVLDNYFFDTDYQRKIKTKGCKLVCVDDMHDKHYVADIVINHGINDVKLFSVECYTHLLLGLEWALLREPFRRQSDSKKNKDGIGSHFVICFGGVDEYHITEKVASILDKEDSISQITAVVGDGHYLPIGADFSLKVQFCRKLSATEMCDLFMTADFGVMSASTVAIEAMACQLPLFLGFYVDNQKGIYQYAINQKYAQGIGNLLEPDMEKLLLQAVVRVGNVRIPFFTFDIKERYVSQFKQIVL